MIHSNGHAAQQLVTQDDLAKLVRIMRLKPYQVFTLPLDAAQTNYEVNIAGDSLYMLDSTDTNVKVTVRLNEIQNDEITLEKQLGVGFPFHRFYLSWDAQSSKTATFIAYTSHLFNIEDGRPGAAGGGGAGVDPVRIHDGVEIVLVNPDGSALVDPIDRAGRLLGIIYGDQGQLLQRTTTRDALVQLRNNGIEIDPRDVLDRAARLLGIIYGDQGQFAQRATSRCAYVQLRHSGSEIDPRAIQSLPNVNIRTGVTVKWAKIDFATSGDQTIVSAVASNKIKMLSGYLIVKGDTDLKWKDGASSDLTGAMGLKAGGGFVWPAPANPDNHHHETSVNTALILNSSAAVQVGGRISYYEEA